MRCFVSGTPEEDHDESDDVGSGVEAEDTLEKIRKFADKRNGKLTVVPMARSMRGRNIVKTQAQKRQVATAQPIPTSR